MIEILFTFMLGLTIGVIIGMFRMVFYYERKKKEEIDAEN